MKQKQVDKFREAARALEADEDERKFDESLRKVTRRGETEKPKEEKSKAKK